MQLCKHSKHKVIDDIWEPRYHDDTVLINKDKLIDGTEHYLIKFTKCSKYPDWFYLSGKVIRRHKTQRNGNGILYVVPMSKRQEFIPIKEGCEHLW